MTLIKFNKHHPARMGRFMPMFDEVFNDFLGGSLAHAGKGAAVNIKEDDKNYFLEFAAPGFEKEEFKISAENSLLTVSAEKKTENNEESNGYTRREFAYSSFQRSFNLPENADSDNIKAAYKNGILNVSIPKKEESKPSTRSINIE